MTKMYNAFGDLVFTDNIETFSKVTGTILKNNYKDKSFIKKIFDKKKGVLLTKKENDKDDRITHFLKKLSEFKKDLEEGTLPKNVIKKRVKELREFYQEKEIPDKIKRAIKDVIENTRMKRDGIRLDGNLELGGVMRSKGYYLSDGSKVKEVIREKNKLAVPIDKEGNITLDTGKDKEVRIRNLKARNLDTLNVKGKRVEIDKMNVKKGINISKGGGISFGIGEDNDPYFLKKYGNRDNNHLRLTLNDNHNESLQIWGNSCATDKCKPNGGRVKHTFDSDGNATHRKELRVANPANGNNPTGWWTHFNYQGKALNYIRGKTEMRGEVNYVDANKGINITNKRNGNNPTGWGTHFNYQGKGLNYIRGKTEMRGEVNYVDANKGINITNKKNGNNPKGWGTHFNYQGKGLNYMRGRTEIRGPSVNIITDSGIRVQSKGKVASFGSQNSGWGHLITNAPRFYMNRSLQVNGGVSSYYNKPLKLPHGAEVEKSLCLKTGNKKVCIDANGLGKIFDDLKMLKSQVNTLSKNNDSIKFGDVVRIVSTNVNGILGSCGYDYVCRRNYAAQIFRRDANYLKSKAWTTFRIVPLHGRRDTGNLKYGQPFRIQMIAGSSFLSTCGYAPRCSNSFLKVSICKNNHPDSRNPVAQWKILGDGKSGNVQYSDVFKLRNNWSSGSFMNVCGSARGCGDNKIRDVNTTRINSLDYKSSTSNWKFEIEK